MDRVARVRAGDAGGVVIFKRISNPEYYTEFEIAVRAPLYMLPLPAVMLSWDQDWVRAIAVWLIGSLMAFLYGHWARDDEDR